MADQDNTIDVVALASELTGAWLSNANTRVNPEDVPAFLSKMYDTVRSLAGDGGTAAPESEVKEYAPAVSVRKSLASPDYIVSMTDGKSYKTLKRHLSTNGMTPAEYRAHYGLKADYPMVAPTYGESRRAMAKKIGLGRKPETASEGSVPAKQPRKPKAPELAAAASEE